MANPQNFLRDLDVPLYDVVEKGADQSGIEHRDTRHGTTSRLLAKLLAMIDKIRRNLDTQEETD